MNARRRGTHPPGVCAGEKGAVELLLGKGNEVAAGEIHLGHGVLQADPADDAAALDVDKRDAPVPGRRRVCDAHGEPRAVHPGRAYLVSQETTHRRLRNEPPARQPRARARRRVHAAQGSRRRSVRCGRCAAQARPRGAAPWATSAGPATWGSGGDSCALRAVPRVRERRRALPRRRR